MTEAEWLSSTIPRAMLMALEDRANAREIDRKLRLFACACARRVWHLLEDERSRKAVEVAERFAEGMASPEQLDAAYDAADGAAWDLYRRGGLHAADIARRRADPEANKRPARVVFGEEPEERVWRAAKAAFYVTCRKVGIPGTKVVFEGGAWVAALTASMCASEAIAGSTELRARAASFETSVESGRFYNEPWQSNLIRCIFGNPFRPVTFDPTRLTPASVALAKSIHTGRSFNLVADLADALEEAGCCDVAMLNHCRKPGEHAGGCWVIDAVLGVE